MKLIRTLIEAKRSDAEPDAQDPQGGPDGAPQDSAGRALSTMSRARRVLSEPLDPRLKEFKSDLAELTPRRTPISTGPKRKKVWDLDAEELATPQENVQTLPIEEPDLPAAREPQQAKTAQPAPDAQISLSHPVEMPTPLQPRKTASGGRVKTRIMGFGSSGPGGDMFERQDEEAPAALEYPIGWLVVTQGPGRGKSFALQNLVSTIGRGEDQAVTLNFGDDTISRNNHAAVAFDDALNACFLGYGGKANLVRLNGRPVLSTEQLTNGDVIRVGETDLRFVALCGPDFTWNEDKAKRDG